jgi:hypothetical protein
MSTNHQCRLVRDLTWEILGASGTLYRYPDDRPSPTTADDPLYAHDEQIEAALFMLAPPIYGGSDQIQHDIVGNRGLGLAREQLSDQSIPYKDLLKN